MEYKKFNELNSEIMNKDTDLGNSTAVNDMSIQNDESDVVMNNDTAVDNAQHTIGNDISVENDESDVVMNNDTAVDNAQHTIGNDISVENDESDVVMNNDTAVDNAQHTISNDMSIEDTESDNIIDEVGKAEDTATDVDNLTADSENIVAGEKLEANDKKTIEKKQVVIENNKNDINNKKVLTKRIVKDLILIIFFGLTLYTVYVISKTLSGGTIASLNEVLSTVDPVFLVVLLLMMIALFFSDGIKYSIISKITTNKFDYLFNVHVGIMGRFYDNITPFNTGGQPVQVYQYYKRGYSSSVATAIPIVKYIFQLISWIVISIILYCANHGVLGYLPQGQATAVASLTYTGIAIASLAPIIVILFSIFPNAIHKVLAFFIKIGCKLKIVKDFDKVDRAVIEFLQSYKQAFVHIAKNIWGIIALFVVSALDFILMMSIPFFVIVALGKTEPSMMLFWNIVTLNAYSLFAASLVPTPGNSGAIEGVASMAFAPIQMGAGALFWVVFIWRFCTYYIYIVIGLVITLFTFIKNRINNKTEK